MGLSHCIGVNLVRHSWLNKGYLKICLTALLFFEFNEETFRIHRKIDLQRCELVDLISSLKPAGQNQVDIS